ncbi:hypothetical protein EW146_g4545 [Bondarzewia mesenterica]|uniref:Uncharacterized protein n=1 Tax=Bondarzewia mesenterica TaxID=1095465 RepID=A0A4S4LW37_9AGAM|nr:hypothetical protein EW146_g4545 [Bondarzewia mesenterica]
MRDGIDGRFPPVLLLEQDLPVQPACSSRLAFLSHGRGVGRLENCTVDVVGAHTARDIKIQVEIGWCSPKGFQAAAGSL